MASDTEWECQVDGGEWHHIGDENAPETNKRLTHSGLVYHLDSDGVGFAALDVYDPDGTFHNVKLRLSRH